MRFLTVVCALALVVGIATVASAEVQNVKVSGDITMRTFWRDNYDLNDKDATGSEAENWFNTIAELQVDADLTDNVSTCIRLMNQRDWDDQAAEDSADDQYKVELDLAYVELKEMLYSPLTLKIGRQDIWLGQGLVIGVKLRDPQAQVKADEYSAVTSFDAIRATLDYDPWTIDLIYSKIEENNNRDTGGLNNDDLDLYVVNVGYAFDSYNGEAEAYYIYQVDRTAIGDNDNTANTIDCIGIRGSFDPLAEATIGAEAAFQAGDFSYNDSNTQRDRMALAVNIMGEYRWPDVRWSPKLGLEWLYLSGETNDDNTDTDDWEGWNPLYVGKAWLAIREWQQVYYSPDYQAANNMNDYSINAEQDSGVSNQIVYLVSGSIAPTENLTIDAVYGHIALAEKVSDSNSEKNIGDEIDITLTYDYTEDVTFSLLTAWFMPGSYFPANQDDNAVDVVGTMKVSF